MTDPKKPSETTTPLVHPYEGKEPPELPEPVDVEAPRSTDRNGEDVPLPDLGGQID